MKSKVLVRCIVFGWHRKLLKDSPRHRYCVPRSVPRAARRRPLPCGMAFEGAKMRERMIRSTASSN